MKVVITGHMGFIGIWMALYLKKRGYEVFGIDNRSSYGDRLFDLLPKDEIFSQSVVGDITDILTLKKFLTSVRPDAVINLAGQAIVPRSFSDPELTFATNALGTLNVLAASSEVATIKTCLCITSDKVYKNNNEDKFFSESDELWGGDIYSSSKVAAENIAQSFYYAHLKKSMSIHTIRLGNVVGGGDWSVNRLIPDLIRAYNNNEIFYVRYLSAIRPFQHVLDVVASISNILDFSLKEVNYSTWNLGPKNNTFLDVQSVIDIFQSEFGELDIESDPSTNKEDLKLAILNNKYVDRFSSPVYDSFESVKATLQFYKKINKSNAVELCNSEVSIFSNEV